MIKRNKKITTIGLMAGTEVGADFFRPWRVAKARATFMEQGIDFVIFPGGLLNIEAINEEFGIFYRKRHNKNPTKANVTSEERRQFCERYIKLIPEEVLTVMKKDNEIIKYWLFPCHLFEQKKDKFGFAAYIYENLSRASQEVTGKDPYIRVGSSGELIEIEDEVAIKTLGIIMPAVSFFRAKVLSTPIEREITYQQLSSVGRPIPDIYIAGAFAATLNEVNPRTVPMPRPYVAIPSLSIKFTETVLQNTLGYAIMRLHSGRKNRAEYEVDFYPLDDAVTLECTHAEQQFKNLPDPNQKKVAQAIVEKIRLGTKVTIGKLEHTTGLSREKVLKALKELKKTNFTVDVDLGELKNPHQIIPKTKKDLTVYRAGEKTSRVFAAGACFHIPDASVDYEFLEKDLPQIIVEDNAETLYLVGDLTEGNKYEQDRKGELLDRSSSPEDQKELAGFLVATRIIVPVFKARYAKTKDVKKSIPRVVTIPGNHDAYNPSGLKPYKRVLLGAATDFIYAHLTAGGAVSPINYLELKALVQELLILKGNPSIDGDIGMLHEYSQSAEQSTGKVQKAIKQFMLLSSAGMLLLANHHEENFSLFRIGNRTVRAIHIGTLKRFYSFEAQRSKISEFGIAIAHEEIQGNTPVRISVKFIPSRIDFQMQDGARFMEENRTRGIRYHDELKKYLNQGEIQS